MRDKIRIRHHGQLSAKASADGIVIRPPLSPEMALLQTMIEAIHRIEEHLGLPLTEFDSGRS
jgi:hypothetical protein